MITPQFVLALSAKLVIDLFAGGGGASSGIEQAIGRHVDLAINHDRIAVAQHRANHPQTRHLTTNVWDIEPRAAIRHFGENCEVGMLWASPDCRHFSPAKGGAPVSDRVRSLAWVVIKWATQVRPDVIFLENIPEFKNWGPVIAGRPCPDRKGKTFRRWRLQLTRLGYQVEFREMKACDYDTPTIRKRLFMVARCDGQPIVWPEPTNGPGLKPYRTAAECIDFTLPCPSIFERKKPLVTPTMRRIAHGVHRYVVDNPAPFIVNTANSKTTGRGRNVWPGNEPLRTITTSNGFAITAPTIARIGQTGGKGKYANSVVEPLTTITTKAEHLLVESHAVEVAGFLAKHYSGEPQDGKTCASLTKPVPTVTTKDHSALVTSTLVKLRGTGRSNSVTEPLHTISAGGTHHAEVRAFLVKYYGTDQDPELRSPLHTITTRDRFALVTVKGCDYVIVDIGMRMLQPPELYAAQGFPSSYIIDWGIDPITDQRITLTKTQQVRMCGNSVCPPLARVLVAANWSDQDMRLAA
jgi:DNA (cytosine-5)-methyltransferase 1